MIMLTTERILWVQRITPTKHWTFCVIWRIQFEVWLRLHSVCKEEKFRDISQVVSFNYMFMQRSCCWLQADEYTSHSWQMATLCNLMIWPDITNPAVMAVSSWLQWNFAWSAHQHLSLMSRLAKIVLCSRNSFVFSFQMIMPQVSKTNVPPCSRHSCRRFLLPREFKVQ
jgi:hypothetical protein